jgi:hypothetical protein
MPSRDEEDEAQKLYREIKYPTRNGKPTRKYKRYLKLRDKMDDSWLKIAGKIGMKL